MSHPFRYTLEVALRTFALTVSVVCLIASVLGFGHITMAGGTTEMSRTTAIVLIALGISGMLRHGRYAK